MYLHMSPQERMERIAQLLLRAMAIEERDRQNDAARNASPAGRPDRRGDHPDDQADADASGSWRFVRQGCDPGVE